VLAAGLCLQRSADPLAKLRGRGRIKEGRKEGKGEGVEEGKGRGGALPPCSFRSWIRQ